MNLLLHGHLCCKNVYRSRLQQVFPYLSMYCQCQICLIKHTLHHICFQCLDISTQLFHVDVFSTIIASMKEPRTLPPHPSPTPTDEHKDKSKYFLFYLHVVKNGTSNNLCYKLYKLLSLGRKILTTKVWNQNPLFQTIHDVRDCQRHRKFKSLRVPWCP